MRRLVGLGLVVGAVLHGGAAAAHAQVQQRDTTRARPDSVSVPAQLSPADSARLAIADSLEDARRRADTVKAPLPHAELPMSLDIGAPYRWDREALAATGAVTLAELLERIPGVVGFRTGWIASPQLASYLGDPAAIRLFVDGLELAPLSTRAAPSFDLSEFALWHLDEVVVERAPSEVRVYMRTWSVRSTTPFTRTDVYTGNEDTNIYRGYFGRRFGRGEALQLAGEQYGTSGDRFGSGDQLALLGRIGIGRSRWAADAFVLRSNRTRLSHEPEAGGTIIPALDSRWTTAYLRAGTGVTDSGPWLQAIAASQAYRGRGTAPVDTADTTGSFSDYILTGGLSVRRARVSALARARVGGGRTRYAQSARLGLVLGPIGLQMLGENGMLDSTSRVDGTLRLRLFGPLEAVASGEYVWDHRDLATNEESIGARAELGLRLGRLWLTGGVLYRDTTALAPARLFEQGFEERIETEALGALATVRGKVWKDVGIDAMVVSWDSEGWHRPQHHAIGRLFVDTRWLRRFPRGNFGFLAWVQGEYRPETPFPVADGAAYSTQNRILSFLIEVRIVDAVLTWQLRNAAPLRETQVPGFFVPGPMQLYGVRWTFWN